MALAGLCSSSLGSENLIETLYDLYHFLRRRDSQSFANSLHGESADLVDLGP